MHIPQYPLLFSFAIGFHQITPSFSHKVRGFWVSSSCQKLWKLAMNTGGKRLGCSFLDISGNSHAFLVCWKGLLALISSFSYFFRLFSTGYCFLFLSILTITLGFFKNKKAFFSTLQKLTAAYKWGVILSLQEDMLLFQA